jgi:sugar-specific transcriptional regulator TrmB
MNIELALKEFGLSEKESKIYLELLKLESIKLQELARRIDIPRTSVFNTLNYLIGKGLVSKVEIKGVSHYSATDPSKFEDILEQKKKYIQSVMPELKSLQNIITNKTSVEVFQGAQGAYSIYLDVFKKKEMKYFFGNYDNLKPLMKHLMPSARQLRIDKKIPAKIMCEPADEEIFHTKTYKNLTEMRQSTSLKEFPGYVFIYGDNVALFTNEKEIVGVIIRNAEVAKMMMLIFEMYWKGAKPFKL